MLELSLHGDGLFRERPSVVLGALFRKLSISLKSVICIFACSIENKVRKEGMQRIMG